MVTSKVALWAKADSKSMLVGEAGARRVESPGAGAWISYVLLPTVARQLPLVTIATTALANLSLWAAFNGSLEFRLAVECDASVCRLLLYDNS